jgi:dUTP pyrophosphatase
MQLKVKKIHPDAVVPKFAKEGDAGMDLYAVEDCSIYEGGRALIQCGICIELEPGFEAQVRSRSGLALKSGVSVMNSPGTIDEGYRGEVCVILVNHGHNGYSVKAGDRVAQLVIKRCEPVEVVEVEELSDSSRGDTGFGSSGV